MWGSHVTYLFSEMTIHSIPKIHVSICVLSLEQRRQKQLLNIMFIHAKKGESRLVTNVNKRSQTKYIFKTDTKMGRKYQKSSFFLGTRLWNRLDKSCLLEIISWGLYIILATCIRKKMYVISIMFFPHYIKTVLCLEDQGLTLNDDLIKKEKKTKKPQFLPGPTPERPHIESLIFFLVPQDHCSLGRLVELEDRHSY